MSSGNPSVELAPLRGSIEINLDALENLEESINNLKDDLTDLSSSIEFTSNIDTLVDQLHELTDGLGDLTEHLTISSNIDDILNQLDSLKDDVTNLDANITFSTNIDGLIDEIDGIKDNLTDIDTTIHIESNIPEVLGQVNDLKRALEESFNIDINGNIGGIDSKLQEVSENIKELQTLTQSEIEFFKGLGASAEELSAKLDNVGVSATECGKEIESGLEEALTETDELKAGLSRLEIGFSSIKQMSQIKGNMTMDGMAHCLADLDDLNVNLAQAKNQLEEVDSTGELSSEEFEDMSNRITQLDGAIFDLKESLVESIRSTNELGEAISKDSGTLEEFYANVSQAEMKLDAFENSVESCGNVDIEGLRGLTEEMEGFQQELSETSSKMIGLKESGELDDDSFGVLQDRLSDTSFQLSKLQDNAGGTIDDFIRAQSPTTRFSGRLSELSSKLLESGQNSLWTGQMISSMMSPIKTVGEEMFELGLKTSSALVVSNHMFGSNATQVDNWSKGTVNSMGLAQGAALTTALQFGMSARTLGANKLQAAGLAEGYTKLAQHINLGTQGSISYQQAAQACLQAMAGQTYGLKALGISFSTSNENAEAAALGYGKAYKSLDPVQQATVRLKLAEKELNKEFGTTGQDLDTNYGKWEKTKAQLEQTGESIGEKLVPTVLKVATDIGKLATKFEHLSTPAKDAVLAIGGIMLIAGPVVETFGLIKLAIGGAMKVFSAFSALIEFNPIVAAFTLIIGAGVLLYEAWTHNFMGMRTETKKAWNDIKTSTEKACTEITTKTKHQWENIKNDSEKGWNYIKGGWHEMTSKVSSEAEQGYREVVSKSKHQWQNIKNDSEKGWNYIREGWHHMTNDVANTVSTWWDKQKTSWEDGYNSLKRSAESWWNHQKTMYDDEVQKITRTWDKCKTETINGWRDIKRTVSTALHDTLSAIERTPLGQQVGKIAHSIEHLVSACKNAVVDIIKALVHAVIERLEDLGEELEQKLYHIAQDFLRVWQDIKNSTEQIMSDVKNIFEQKWNDLCNWFDEYVGKPAEKAEQMLDKFTRYISNGMEAAQQDFDSRWNVLCNWFAVHVGRPVEHVATMFSQFVSYVGNGIQSAENRFVSGWDSLCGWFSAHVNRIVSAVSQTFNMFTSFVGKGIQSARNRFENGWSSLCGWFSFHVGKPVSAVGEMASRFESRISDTIQLASNIFQSRWNSLCGWFGSASYKIVSEVENLGGGMISAGEKIMNDLMSGLLNGWYSVTNWVANEINGLANKVSSEASHIVGDITRWGNDGSHATGLTYVPWDGYRAELHKGEMVLTAEQAENYNKGGNGGTAGNTYNFYSPEPIDPFEAKRQMIDASRKLANGFY